MGSQTSCCGCPIRAPLWPGAVPAGVPRSELRPLRSKRSTATANHVQQYHTVGEDHKLCSCCGKVRVDDKIVCMLWYCYCCTSCATRKQESDVHAVFTSVSSLELQWTSDLEDRCLPFLTHQPPATRLAATRDMLIAARICVYAVVE